VTDHKHKKAAQKFPEILKYAFQQCFQTIKHAGRGAFGMQETTSKGTRPNRSYVNEIKMY